ncbi:DUF6907 domain-containing protein [Streptomyces sp. ID05-47C]|uniref:DUF6907 domain-containing protein n=1 Tax=Streptomyces sp. ID05-47C TaxID=3028665 RepID=UPI0029B66BF0|nr:hypothetical protein [Streptomyces sp. ID05-47C]MDX3571946.1 hypothetical protein [Streptomyces sp. ID05-47C]
MSTEPRTVTLATEDHGDVTLTEPDWCRGHQDHHPDSYRADITHYGTEERLTFNGEALYVVMLAQTPMSENADHDVSLYVEQAGHTGGFTPTGLYDLAAALDGHADRLRDLADQLARILAGGSE